MAEQGQPISNIPDDRNQERRDRDKTRRNSLTTEQKEKINARRRAKQNSLAPEQKKEINAARREIITSQYENIDVTDYLCRFRR